MNRVVFSKIKTPPICEESVKMVAGRAGNNKVNGIISAFRQTDLDFLKYILKKNYKGDKNLQFIKRACLFPPLKILKEFMKIMKSFDNKKGISISEMLIKYPFFIKDSKQFQNWMINIY